MAWSAAYVSATACVVRYSARRLADWSWATGTLQPETRGFWSITRCVDLKTLQWIYEHACVTASGEADAIWSDTGERGLVLPIIGVECKTCFQSLVEKWVGTENLAYFVADAPENVEECLLTMRRASKRTAELSAASAAEGFIFWEDSSTTNISPSSQGLRRLR